MLDALKGTVAVLIVRRLRPRPAIVRASAPFSATFFRSG